MKILNLYCGIGGNRKGWQIGSNDEVVAVELDEKIAAIYKENFPKDKIIIGDAHEYLLEHFREFDFIWSSPPCPSHSAVRKKLAFKKKADGQIYEQNKPIYPDMKLYQEIILLDNYYNGFFCVENVMPYYQPLIEPIKLGRHCFWTNLNLNKINFTPRGSFDNIEELAQKLGFDISNWKNVKKVLLLRNCCEPEISRYIYNEFLKARGIKSKRQNIKQTTIFDFI